MSQLAVRRLTERKERQEKDLETERAANEKCRKREKEMGVREPGGV